MALDRITGAPGSSKKLIDCAGRHVECVKQWRLDKIPDFETWQKIDKLKIKNNKQKKKQKHKNQKRHQIKQNKKNQMMIIIII